MNPCLSKLWVRDETLLLLRRGSMIVVKYHWCTIDKYYRTGNISESTIPILLGASEDVAVSSFLNPLEKRSVKEDMSFYVINNKKFIYAASSYLSRLGTLSLNKALGSVSLVRKCLYSFLSSFTCSAATPQLIKNIALKLKSGRQLDTCFTILAISCTDVQIVVDKSIFGFFTGITCKTGKVRRSSLEDWTSFWI